MEINRFSFLIEAKEDISLPPFKGPALRGGLGHALKKIVCIYSGPCKEDDCPVRKSCVFKRLFEPKEGGRNIPAPYLIEPPLDGKRHYRPGEEIRFQLVLFGNAVNYLPYFIYAFEVLGEIGLGKGKGKFTLTFVSAVREDEEIGIYNGQTKMLSTKKLPILFEDFKKGDNLSKLLIETITPVHIELEGQTLKTVEDFCFYNLFKALLGRLSTLSHFYGDKKFEWDYKGLLEAAKKVTIDEPASTISFTTIRRFSQRRKKEDLLTGVEGRLVYRGKELNTFFPYLKFGQYAHLGGRTTFGLGAYRVLKFT